MSYVVIELLLQQLHKQYTLNNVIIPYIDRKPFYYKPCSLLKELHTRSSFWSQSTFFTFVQKFLCINGNSSATLNTIFPRFCCIHKSVFMFLYLWLMADDACVCVCVFVASLSPHECSVFVFFLEMMVLLMITLELVLWISRKCLILMVYTKNTSLFVIFLFIFAKCQLTVDWLQSLVIV